jgi:hypothetical protein
MRVITDLTLFFATILLLPEGSALHEPDYEMRRSCHRFLNELIHFGQFKLCMYMPMYLAAKQNILKQSKQ